MPQDTHIEMLNSDAERTPETAQRSWDPTWTLWPPPRPISAAGWSGCREPALARYFSERNNALRAALRPVLATFRGPLPKRPIGDDFRWVYDNLRLLHSDLRGMKEGFKLVRKIPHVRTPDGAITPRVVALAAGYLAAAGYEFSEKSLNAYVQAFQQSTALRLHELWALVPALKLVLLEEIAARGSKVTADPEGSYGVGVCVRSLRDISQTGWKEVLEPLILFDRILREDPAGAYPRMDFESRDLYRTELADIAQYSDLPEAEHCRQSSRDGAGGQAGEALQPAAGGPARPCWLLSDRGRICCPAGRGGLSASTGAQDCVFSAAAS